MANERRYQFSTLVEGNNQAVFITGVDFLAHETIGGYEPLISLSLESTWSIEHVLWCVVNNVHLVVFILIELILFWPIDLDLV